jgi:4-amino-4-deoxy-L-arabinose transferase-like glycosyltransferase
VGFKAYRRCVTTYLIADEAERSGFSSLARRQAPDDAGPIVGFLAATGIASVLGAVVFGVVGLVVVLAVAAVLWHRRRRRQHCEPTGSRSRLR